MLKLVTTKTKAPNRGLMELAGLEPATSWVRLAPALFGRDCSGLLRLRRLRQVGSDALSSVSRLVARPLAS